MFSVFPTPVDFSLQESMDSTIFTLANFLNEKYTRELGFLDWIGMRRIQNV